MECGTTRKITDLWEPRWQWDMEGLLCKECFDKKEEDHGKKKNFCAICGGKIGLLRYNPTGTLEDRGSDVPKLLGREKGRARIS